MSDQTHDQQQRALAALTFLEARNAALLQPGALGIEVYAPPALSDDIGLSPALGFILHAIQLQLPSILTSAETAARFHAVPSWEDDGS